MKATELMIYDWVNLSKGNWSENRQVGLNDIEMIVECVYLAEPIPLTPEILEKNGFDVESHETPAAFAYKKEGVSIVEVYWNGPEHGYRCIFSYGDTRLRITCHFVHELQHALRICGVEKEIEL